MQKQDGDDVREKNSYAEVWRALGRATGCEVLERNGLLTYFSLAPAPDLNPTIALEEPDDPAAALEQLEKEYDRKGIGFGFETPSGVAPRLENAALERGMKLHHADPAMVLHPIPALEDLTGYDIQVVQNEEQFRHQLVTQAHGFSMELDVLAAFAPATMLKASTFFLAYLDGTPAATSIIVITGSEAGIFGVSTKPELRNRGLGRAVTQASVQHAAQAGCDFVYLHSSKLGLPVYRRIGFRAVNTYSVYTYPQKT